MVRAGRAVLHLACPALAHQQQATTRGSRVRKLAVGFDQLGRWTSPVQTPEQNRGCRLDDGARSVAEDIGEADVSSVLTQTNRVGQVRVGVIFDHEMRRTALASQACVDALEKLLSAGHCSLPVSIACERSRHCFLRTGGACDSFRASSISDSAPLVPSIASSSVSR